MNQYLVYVESYLPWPMSKEYKIEASSFGTAARRAIKKFRKELNGRKKLKEIRLKIIRV